MMTEIFHSWYLHVCNVINFLVRRDGGAHPVRHLHGLPVRPAQGKVPCPVLNCNVLQCNVLKCTVLYCTVLQVQYATALDWFIICSFLYCVATILEFAGVHYFTKVRGQ